MKRGQILTYDAIGGVVIFLIAVGILLTYWSSSTASYTRDSVLVTQANIILDNFLGSEFFESQLHLTEQKNQIEFCKLIEGNKTQLGIYNYYNITIYNKEDEQLLSCAPDWKELNDIMVSQRIVFYGEENETVKIVLKITG